MNHYRQISNMLDITPLKFGRVTVRLWTSVKTTRYECKAPGVRESYSYARNRPNDPFAKYDTLAAHRAAVLAVLDFIEAHAWQEQAS